MSQKKRIFNCRILFFVFVMFVLGILYNNFINRDFVIYTIIVGLAIAVTIFCCIYYKHFILMFVLIATLGAGYGYTELRIKKYEDTPVYADPVNIIGTIHNADAEMNGYQVVYLSDLSFDGKKVSGMLKLKVNDSTSVFKCNTLGNVILLNTFVAKQGLEYNDKEILNSYNMYKNIKYYATINVSYVTVLEYNPSIAQRIKNKIEENLQPGLNNENSGLAFSSIFGDKTNLSSDVKDSFRDSGVSHLLAVSGLHVGLIVSALLFLFKKLKMNDIVQLIVLMAILIFYAYLCNFSISIVRATIMTFCLLLAPIVYSEYDIISAISFAGIITLLLNPLEVYDAGWLMSFGCVFGIAMFAQPLTSFFYKLKFGKLASSVAVSLSTQITILLIMVMYYNNIQILSLVANIFLIPLFTIAFTAIFFISFVSLILPFVSYTLYVVNPLMSLIILLTYLISSVPFAVISTSSVNYCSLLIYFCMLAFLSKYCMLDKDVKFTTLVFFVSILVVNIVVEGVL